MSRSKFVFGALLAGLLLGGCGSKGVDGKGLGLGGGGAPKGQVVATVAGREITLRDLQVELSGATMPSDPKAQKALQARALQALVARTLVAKAAHDEGLDKSPDYAMQRRRAEDGLLAQLWQAKLVNSVPDPAPEEVDRFVTDHPGLFSERKIYTVDQIRFAPTNPALLQQLKPLNTLTEVEALLAREHVDYQKAENVIDPLTTDPRLVDGIVKLPPNSVFITPGEGSLVANQITSSRPLPFTGAQAQRFATAVLKRQHAEEALQRQVSNLLRQGTSEVRYNPTYQPPVAASSSPAAASSSAAPAR